MKQVIKGAKYLDKIMPGWAKKIKIRKFNIQSTMQCVIAQLYGGYPNFDSNSPVEKKSDKFVFDHGFELSGVNADYKPLQEAWLEEIRSRR